METATQQLDKIQAIWQEHLEVAQALRELGAAVSTAVDTIFDSLAAGGQLFTAGTGRSAAAAQHIAAKLRGRFLRDRRPLRAAAGFVP